MAASAWPDSTTQVRESKAEPRAYPRALHGTRRRPRQQPLVGRRQHATPTPGVHPECPRLWVFVARSVRVPPCKW